MRFVGRRDEMARLDRLLGGREGRLGVVCGRRRVGKTRLLVEWTRTRGGVYAAADPSAAAVQRDRLAQALAERFPSFADARYPSWSALLERLARAAVAMGWRGPLVLDDVPFLVASSPELPGALRLWLERAAKRARLTVVLAGSSPRLLSKLALAPGAPLFGKAREVIELAPLPARALRAAFGAVGAIEAVELLAAWGGVPRYWQLAAAEKGAVRSRVEALVLDPAGPLHREGDALLLEELPPAMELRPLLDALGGEPRRLSDVAQHLRRPATSISRPLQRLLELGLVRREIPFGDAQGESRRSLYQISDPFLRLWFQVVAPHRSTLTRASRAARLQLLRSVWGALVAQAWGELCRHCLPRLAAGTALGRAGPWLSGSRWWHKQSDPWAVAALTAAGDRLLFGEAPWRASPWPRAVVGQLARQVALRAAPSLPGELGRLPAMRALFLAEVERGCPRWIDGVLVVTGAEVLR